MLGLRDNPLTGAGAPAADGLRVKVRLGLKANPLTLTGARGQPP